MVMHKQLEKYNAWDNAKGKRWEQGFIDNYGDFHNRKESLEIVKSGRQAFMFNAVRNVCEDELYSEGLY